MRDLLTRLLSSIYFRSGTNHLSSMNVGLLEDSPVKQAYILNPKEHMF